jgi:threonine dehydrogenase-like Zn-dependent dehydrogenase
MKAVVVTPLQAGSGRVTEVPDPKMRTDEVLVRVRQVGVCGTDLEILNGEYGTAPDGEEYLIIGHESLGQVEEVGANAEDLSPGDWVVAMVRRPDPVPCRNCAAGEWDMCLNGLFLERGIKGQHGFLAELYAEQPRFLVKVPERIVPFAVLLEPMTVGEKAVDQIQRIQSRLFWGPERAMVLGAGTIGLLAGMLLRLGGIEVYFYDRAEKGIKREFAEAIGATYIWADQHKLADLPGQIGRVDIVVEATGYSPLAFEAMDVVGKNGIVCLSGVSGGERQQSINTDRLNMEMVLSNKVVFGTVNANQRHFRMGVRHLVMIDALVPGLLSRMITDRLPLDANLLTSLTSPSTSIKRVVTVS